tara:strand:- start:1324 stop:1854 length:531 start_codon:yes stop_codon:yes gene_type:complete
MKLKSVLEALVKNKWSSVSSSDIKDYAPNILDLIKTAYKSIGGHPNYKSIGDVSSDQMYTVIDLDDDPDIDATIVSKRKPGGTKLVATGHDNSKPAKSAVVKNTVTQLKKPGHYIEVSGRIKDILLAKGVPVITDRDVISKVMKGKDLEFIGDDGEYKRKIGGQTHTKILLGKPRT